MLACYVPGAYFQYHQHHIGLFQHHFSGPTMLWNINVCLWCPIVNLPVYRWTVFQGKNTGTAELRSQTLPVPFFELLTLHFRSSGFSELPKWAQTHTSYDGYNFLTSTTDSPPHLQASQQQKQETKITKGLMNKPLQLKFSICFA